MSKRSEKSKNTEDLLDNQSHSSELIPLIPLKDIVVFPNCITPLFVMRPKSLNALEDAVASDKRLFLVTQKAVDVENPAPSDLYEHGTVSEILQVLKMPDGAAKILVEGQYVARILGYEQNDRTTQAMLIKQEVATTAGRDREALLRLVLNQFETYVKLYDKIPDELFVSIKNFDDALQIANAISHYANFKTKDKQQLLELDQLDKKLLTLSQLLSNENELLELEGKIMTQVKSQIGKSQKEYFLNEQLKVIEKELGLNSEEDVEIEELAEKIEKSKMPDEAREKAQRELARLAKMAPMSPEATVSRTYIEWLLDLPWGKATKDKRDLDHAQQILDEDHYGLSKVKDRIIEYLAVHQLTKHVKGPILCLVGPPGVGKTSLARSVARSLGRKFVRISLGGVRDEAEIRGHRRTYIGSLPGKILQAMKKAGASNPVMLLDEIDKMSADFRGDPASALLEVLDPEQNKAFNDHYLEVDYDLSDVFFITTANTTAGIPYPLMDRMELIRIPGYTEDEKLEIAERYLVPKQVQANGLSIKTIDFTRRAIQVIINNYTREAGVRNLEREIATVCRRIAKDLVRSTDKKAGSKQVKVTPEKIRTLLGPIRHKDNLAQKEPEIGVATGLAWTEVGGELLPAEVTVMKGRGNLVLTGKLGEVMQESAKAALSYIRSRSDKLNVPVDFYRNTDIHVHIPEGAIPKDGPSAGITMTTSMVSALTNRPVRQDIAMTGEITLRGKVLKIGGLKEKVLAAHRAHIMNIIIPQDNEDDLEDISKKIRREMNFVLVDTVDQVLENALLTATVPTDPRIFSSRAPRRTVPITKGN
ncbi:MAG: endopeptidase La [Candidatus Sumerlaeaceae bacterium]